MPYAFARILFSLLLLLPLAAHAGEADDFVAARATQQAKLLESWAAMPDPTRQPLLDVLQQGRVAADSDKRAFIETDAGYRAVEGLSLIHI